MATLERTPTRARERLLSLRANDEEFFAVHQLAATKGLTVSALIRHALVAEGLRLPADGQ
jgi:hypothetical protein